MDVKDIVDDSGNFTHKKSATMISLLPQPSYNQDGTSKADSEEVRKFNALFAIGQNLHKSVAKRLGI